MAVMVAVDVWVEVAVVGSSSCGGSSCRGCRCGISAHGFYNKALGVLFGDLFGNLFHTHGSTRILGLHNGHCMKFAVFFAAILDTVASVILDAFVLAVIE